MIALKHILVATDFSDTADRALLYARDLACTFGASLHVLHVEQGVFMRPVAANPAALEEAVHHRLQQRLTDHDRSVLHAITVVEMGDDPAEAIVRYARLEGVDLIVTGSHGRSGLAHALMGSVAERVVRTAPCPVLTVRQSARRPVVDYDVCDQFARAAG